MTENFFRHCKWEKSLASDGNRHEFLRLCLW